MNDCIISGLDFTIASAILWPAALRAEARAGLRASAMDGRTLTLFLLSGAVAIVVCANGTGSAVIPVALAAISACAATDLRCGFVFDRITIPALAALLGFALVTECVRPAFLGTLCASGAIVSLWALSQRRGIGLGDAKLAAIVGAALGPSRSLVALGLAFICGAAFAIGGLITGRLKRGDSVRFAPYIAAGTLCSLLAGGLTP
ncbi:MAG: prepilin peptidase [Candidatus Eremiobacteraeota bacterium]|nr:prepilin peptidase [Candidatus Eremiobacteraeota bacterium]